MNDGDSLENFVIECRLRAIDKEACRVVGEKVAKAFSICKTVKKR